MPEPRHILYTIPLSIKATAVSIDNVSAMLNDQKHQCVGIAFNLIQDPKKRVMFALTQEEATKLIETVEQVLQFCKAKKDNAN